MAEALGIGRDLARDRNNQRDTSSEPKCGHQARRRGWENDFHRRAGACQPDGARYLDQSALDLPHGTLRENEERPECCEGDHKHFHLEAKAEDHQGQRQQGNGGYWTQHFDGQRGRVVG